MVLAALFVDPLPVELTSKRDKSSVCEQVMVDVSAAVRCLRHKKMMLIVPLSVYGGMFSVFYMAEWNQVSEFCFLSP